MDVKPRRIPLLNHLLVVLITALVVYLVVDFGKQVADSNAHDDELQEAEAAVAAASEETARLEAEYARALSSDAVEQFGRDMGYARDNEVPVVVPNLPALSPSEEGDSQPGEAETYHRAWWDLFFGEER